MMTTNIHMVPASGPADPADTPGPWSRDYARLAEAIRYLDEHSADQPGLDEVAAHLGLSPAHFQRLFSRWVGLSPKKFLKLLTHAHARALLAGKASVLDASYEAGLSGPGRLHDLFVTLESMTPGEVKSGGAGLTLSYGWHDSPFGPCLLVACGRGLTGLAFADPGGEAAALEEMRGRWPNADYVHAPDVTEPLSKRIFPKEPRRRGRAGAGEAAASSPRKRESSPLALLVGGSAFQVQVWRALLEIPPGAAASYGDIAARLGRDGAVRAVGTAVGANPVAYLIPCHRVLRKTAALGGYHWGVERKRAILAWEAARIEGAAA